LEFAESTGVMLRSCSSFAGQGVVHKDPNVWLDEALQLPISLIMSFTNSYFNKLGPYDKNISYISSKVCERIRISLGEGRRFDSNV